VLLSYLPSSFFATIPSSSVASGHLDSPAVPFNEMTLGMIKNMPQADPKDAPNLDPMILTEEIDDNS
jgi:hypothetical protein